MDKGFFDLLKSPYGKRVAAIIFFGIVLMLVAGFITQPSQKTEDSLLETCAAVEGVGKCRVMTSKNREGEVVSVVVLCQGGDSLSVKEDLYQLISALYGIGYNRISILKISE